MTLRMRRMMSPSSPSGMGLMRGFILARGMVVVRVMGVGLVMAMVKGAMGRERGREREREREKNEWWMD
jgi:hypothetical protein